MKAAKMLWHRNISTIVKGKGNNKQYQKDIFIYLVESGYRKYCGSSLRAGCLVNSFVGFDVMVLRNFTSNLCIKCVVVFLKCGCIFYSVYESSVFALGHRDWLRKVSIIAEDDFMIFRPDVPHWWTLHVCQQRSGVPDRVQTQARDDDDGMCMREMKGKKRSRGLFLQCYSTFSFAEDWLFVHLMSI